MSAFYAVAFEDHIELITDGVVYLDDGTLTDIRRKVWTSARHPIAVTGRGDIGAVAATATAFLMSASLRGSVDEALEAFQAALDRNRRDDVAIPVEMLICAISETRGPLLAYFVTADVHRNGTEPWLLIDVGHEFGGGAKFDPEDLAGLSPAEGVRGVAVPLFNAMRKIKDTNPTLPESEPIHGVGGHIDFTAVRREGCTVERIHEWPEDVVGRKIEPVREAISLPVYTE